MTHERAPHNTDGPARTAAAAAQARAEDAFALADGKVDAGGAATAARQVTSDWAEEDNPDPIPAPKLVNVIECTRRYCQRSRWPPARIAGRHEVGVVAEGGIFIAADFARPSPPIGGSISGMSDGLAAPPFPPGARGGSDAVPGDLAGRRSRRCGD